MYTGRSAEHKKKTRGKIQGITARPEEKERKKREHQTRYDTKT